MKSLEIPEWLLLEPFQITKREKSELLGQALFDLTTWHYHNCAAYRRILEVSSWDKKLSDELASLPFIPVSLFKKFELLSVDRESIFKTMTSSGTSGQQVSKIFLDRHTASNQIKVLSKLITSVLGKQRLPMLIIDSPATLKDRKAFSARGAGILGFSMFGKDVTYALDDGMNLNIKAVNEFLERNPNGPLFIFGFTFIVWKNFIQQLKDRGEKVDLQRGTLLHGGGWKKLQNISMNSRSFGAALESVTSLTKVVNYYGMVEQTGSLFMECNQGYLHSPVFADVITRRNRDLQPAKFGEPGVLQVLSMLPKSYPGHSLLTEDLGVVYGEDDCSCGWRGKYFHVTGRAPKTEIRGCSDTYEFQ